MTTAESGATKASGRFTAIQTVGQSRNATAEWRYPWYLGVHLGRPYQVVHAWSFSMIPGSIPRCSRSGRRAAARSPRPSSRRSSGLVSAGRSVSIGATTGSVTVTPRDALRKTTPFCGCRLESFPSWADQAPQGTAQPGEGDRALGRERAERAVVRRLREPAPASSCSPTGAIAIRSPSPSPAAGAAQSAIQISPRATPSPWHRETSHLQDLCRDRRQSAPRSTGSGSASRAASWRLRSDCHPSGNTDRFVPA